MAVNIHNLIAAISPDIYCDASARKEVKQIAKEAGYLAAAEKAKPVERQPMSYDIGKNVDPFKKIGLKAPVEFHQLVYDSAAEGLEPVYFWIFDQMNERFSGKVDKLIDNFSSTVGSGHFSELGQKLSRMQEEAMKMLGSANQVIKSILNIIYDLKEFKLRLALYDKLKSEKKDERESAMLSLKQVWLDTVDVKRGGTSVKGMALSGQSYFVTLIDAFMAAENEKLEFEGKEIDLNERVKRILKQRVQEFFLWLKESEHELRKRFEIEKTYLKSQVNTVKLYARWAKPYLTAAKQLEQRESSSAALVSAFNTILLELNLMGFKKYNPEDDVRAGKLPKMFKKATDREYYRLLIVEFKFRGIPQKVGQHYAFGGRTEVYFSSYSLNNQELEVLRKEIDRDNFGDILQLIQGATEESLKQLADDIEEFTGEKKTEEKESKESADVNPFAALFSFMKFSKWKNKEKWDASKEIEPDSEPERIIRSQAIVEAREECFDVFDIYKKLHGMPSHINPYASV